MSVRLLLLLSVAVLSVHGEVLHQSSFEENPQPLSQGTWEGIKREFVPGVTGRAIHIEGKNDVTLNQTIDIPRNEGTLSFWLKTDWPGNDGKRHDVLGLGKDFGIRVLKNEKNELLFFWVPKKGRQVRMDCSIEKTWPANEWRHLAFTWKDGAYAVYVDGSLHQRKVFMRDSDSLPALDMLLIGCFADASADLSVDDLIVHDRELDRREVRDIFVTGIEQLEHRSVTRLVVRFLINQKPATLILDTGSTLNCLFRDFALQAGVTPLPSYRGSSIFQEEADAIVTLKEGPAFEQRFALLKNIAGMHQQGIVGWAQFFEANRLHILWEERTMLPLSKEVTEKMTRGWKAHPYPAGQGSLRLPPLSIRINEIELNLPVIVDTGESGGLTLTSKTWASVLPKLSSSKKSLNAAWTPANGQKTFITVLPQSIEMLGASMSDVSISENRHQKREGQNEEYASIGLAALSFFDVVIDGEKGVLWLRPRATPAIRENMNYSGLLIHYASNGAGHEIEVLAESPAWHLGLRSKDCILEVDGNAPDLTNTDGLILLKDRISDGRPIKLKLLRGSKQLEVSSVPSEAP